MRRFVVALVVVAACGSDPCPGIRGSRSQLTVAPAADVSTCDGGRSYYVVVHGGKGTRHLDYSIQPKANFIESGPCDKVGADPAQCPTVTLQAFAWSVHDALVAKLDQHADGIGIGACATFPATGPSGHTSTSIHDWTYANQAVEIVSDQIAQWELADDYGVNLRPADCAVPE
jgi:hypothetical protein